MRNTSAHLSVSALSATFSKALMKSRLPAAEKARILIVVTSIRDPAVKAGCRGVADVPPVQLPLKGFVNDAILKLWGLHMIAHKFAIILSLIELVGCRSSSLNSNHPVSPGDSIEVPVAPATPSTPSDPDVPETPSDPNAPAKPNLEPTEPVKPSAVLFNFAFSGGTYSATVDGNGEINVTDGSVRFNSLLIVGNTVDGSQLLANPTSYCNQIASLVESAKNGSANALDLVRNTKPFLLTANFFPVLSGEFKAELTKAAEKARPGFSSYFWANRPKIVDTKLEIQTGAAALYAQLASDSKAEQALAAALTSSAARSSGVFKVELNASDLVCDLVQQKAKLQIRFKAFDREVLTTVSGI